MTLYFELFALIVAGLSDSSSTCGVHEPDIKSVPFIVMSVDGLPIVIDVAFSYSDTVDPMIVSDVSSFVVILYKLLIFINNKYFK